MGTCELIFLRYQNNKIRPTSPDRSHHQKQVQFLNFENLKILQSFSRQFSIADSHKIFFSQDWMDSIKIHEI